MDVAYALQKNLEYESDPTVWDQGVFRPMRQTLVDLVEESGRTDFAVFVFAPDDVAAIRGETVTIVRDNVLFELGIFIGALGPERCFVVAPRDAPSLHLPSDLLGLAPIRYAADRRDGRLRAALGPASHDILTSIRALGRKPETPISPPQLHSPLADATLDVHRLTKRFIDDWNGPDLAAFRTRLRSPVPLHVMEDEDGLATEAIQNVFYFLNTMAEALLAGRLIEAEARPVFENPVRQVWSHAFTYLAPLNQADEAWNPLPPIAQLDREWRKDSL
ncbi:MAG: hypothetical protein B7Y86_08685 [Brevundimonas subvibrioides]|uniref:CD-NTase-associated protein 12/Pycsar effector protein TIR domain-containing protein n=1 Tax=Brevundimonas subvibrioides TaxID=74313 RepID=A0A258HJP0_9CAUL|nr:MAG: hypothetical protein B7Y86_08685 [Brevundimonas subvibrioides]